MNGMDNSAQVDPQTIADVRRQYGLEGKFVAAYVGTIGMACGLSVVLRAAQKLRAAGDDRFRFLLVGDGAVREELENEAREKELNSVIFTGRVAKDRGTACLAASDVALIHLKKNDLFKTVIPSKMFDAFAVSKPIVLGVAGDAAELLQEFGAGHAIEPESETDLIHVLHALAETPNVASAMGASGHRFAGARFDRDALAQTYLDRIESIVSGRRPNVHDTAPATPR